MGKPDPRTTTDDNPTHVERGGYNDWHRGVSYADCPSWYDEDDRREWRSGWLAAEHMFQEGLKHVRT